MSDVKSQRVGAPEINQRTNQSGRPVYQNIVILTADSGSSRLYLHKENNLKVVGYKL